MDDTIQTQTRGRGRPLGFKLSDLSKQAISDSKRGQHHSEITKDKISKTLMRYFRNMYPLSDELYLQYKDIIASSEEIREWFYDIRSAYDSTSDVFTERSLNSKRYREVSIELNVSMEENPNFTQLLNSPEDICELRQQCEDSDLDFEIVCGALGVKF